MLIAGFDCETIPNQRIPEGAMPKFDPDDVAWGNLKDPAKREARLPEKEAEFNEKLSKKTRSCLFGNRRKKFD